jgi:hypothetical protein
VLLRASGAAPDVCPRPYTSDGMSVCHNYCVDWSKDCSCLSSIFAVHVTVECKVYEMKPFLCSFHLPGATSVDC